MSPAHSSSYLADPVTDVNNWRTEVKGWLRRRWNDFEASSESIVAFFELAFDHTQRPDRAWFGVHQSTVSLVVGGIFLASIMKSSQDRGFWLLIDQRLPMGGIEYHPVKATRDSQFPLVWAHDASLSLIPALLTYDLLWQSFASASEKIHYARRIAGNRDAVQQRRKKKRLSDFWCKASMHLFPDEIVSESPLREGAKSQITVNAYERDPRARRKCLAHYGTQCFICGFSFGDVYGEVAAGFIHVHHIRPLAEIGAEYVVDPVEDLRPVCPSCHAVLHLRKPAFTLQEVMELLRQKQT